ncbi:ferredoxin [Geosporobacter ferrireducens]|uniref:Ferredoxin n=1 Tax=Geosporobacter ferrireducens TaxID=1424294 RepID=A0A1D8GQ08_9FIRM|nr:ferredoxin [Geosporobacter ferrireducens]MTI56866.1 four-helix bundle copper-binding protein [Geosporobacter ferrireducens]
MVETIQNCEAVCEHMTTHLKHRYDIHYRVRQLQFLRDCADICGLTAKFIARNSCFAKQAATLCAYICEVCGAECARFPDAESQSCAQICMHCARECRAFVIM